MKKIFRIILLSLIVNPLFPDLVFSNDYPVLSHEFWFFTQSAPDLLDQDFSGVKKTPEDEAGERLSELLEEAVFVYSGMIYGFKFSYTPGDARRNIREVFELDPAGRIVWGDPALKSAGVRKTDNRIFVRINYTTGERHANWLRYWESSAFSSSGGTAEGIPEAGAAGKIDALDKALKEAVRAWLRPRLFNKPRSVEGEFVITQPPYYVYQAGRYTCSVKIRLMVSDVEKYRFY